ncbi:Pal1 cell morphology protein-domain-containing protein, partial [Cytidiella melzeri]
VEKAKATSRRNPQKKGSAHADVIDRLDYSGVGGPMFHHDGPFDACAPSRNRHRTKAPMLAWTGTASEDKEALANAREIPASYQSPYPSPGVYAPYEAPKKKHDAIAEAWGIHEPEPFEDFSAGGGYAAGGHSEFGTPRGTTALRRGKEPQDTRGKYKEYLEEGPGAGARRQQTKRTPIPPPQPIFALEGDAETNVQPPSPTSPGAPKRTKSLMHRIRKMRENPMVPPMQEEAGYAEQEYSPPSPTDNGNGAHHPQRPTHRSQNSFLGGIFGQKAKDLPSPDEPFVYVDESAPNGRREKSLPRPPTRDAGGDGYFDNEYSNGASLGRKTSLLKKVKTAVKANK